MRERYAPSVDVRQLAAIVAVADHGTFSAAARALYTVQSNVSGHLACLKECGLIAVRPEGRAMHYRLAAPAIVDLLRHAEVLLAEVGERVELCENYRVPR